VQIAGAVVAVTGATGGIGSATCAALHAAGARVVATGRDPGELSRIRERYGAEPVPGDVRDSGHAAEVVDAALSRFGRLDGLVLNAGIGHAGSFAKLPPERIDELVDVNVRAPLQLLRAAVPHLLAAQGAVVFVSSIAGAVPVAGEAAYATTKHALEALGDALRTELRPAGVSVSVVRPGVVATRFFDRRGEAYDRRFPRPIPPERIADAIVAALASGRPRTTVPGWLAVPAALRRTAPALYNRLAGH
jgi:NADP-dependent 3-hydroxy acid dehydrogenase YdfG